MKLRKVIGGALVSSPFVLIFGLMTAKDGWTFTLVFLASFGLTMGAMVFGIRLLTNGENE